MASDSDALDTLRGLPPRHVEQFVADLWDRAQGWATEVSDAGPDAGVDVMGQPPGRPNDKTAVQVKRYQPGTNVTSREIQQYAALRQQYSDVTGVTVVTTSDFTSAARDRADELGVRLLDGTDLAALVARHDAGDILDWYAAGKPATRP